MAESNKQGKLVIVSGPSGVGKSTICRMLAEKLDAFVSVSTTTRPKSDSEEDGREYRFISRDAFEQMIREGDFLEHADVFGNYYGTPREPIDRALADGRVVILEIDVQGALQVKKMRPEAKTFFILPPRKEDLLKRMDHRNRGEDEHSRRRRLEAAGREIAAGWQHYDHMVINDDLNTAVNEIIDWIEDKKEEHV